MVREATISDIPAIVEMGERFAAKAELPFAYCPDSVGFTVEQLILNPLGLVYISDTGAVGGLCHPHPYNHEIMVGQELFWWSEGRDGAALFDALEAGAKALGARFWSMITLESIKPKVIGKIYERRGYRSLEHSYIKEL